MQLVEANKLYTVKEVSTTLSVSVATIYNMINRGELPFVRGKSTRILRIRGDDLNNWARGQQDGKTTERDRYSTQT
jgi:excisionase family DNA binding protein